MKTRSISAIGIVLVSILPAIIGSWIFAATIAIVFALAFDELLKLVNAHDQFTRWYGIALIAAACAVAVQWPGGRALPLILLLLVLVPAVKVIFQITAAHNRGDWAIRVGCAAYLTFAAYAAVSLRETAGVSEAAWVRDLVEKMPGPSDSSVGLGWFFFALFITWMSDTFAYLVGRSIGKHKLIPRVSPNKTIEGALGGLAAASITAVLVVNLFGLPMETWIAALFGVGLGILGMLGDLFESQLKRRAQVKDSGDAIPGHGGFFDRIDALIWVLLATFALVPFLT
ncbi:MAG: phosphatidate cytidylyltransferase [Thermomicrobiales bacterium]|nr:phosphatidate cytidylyltransferase [Thermomicrobiales bacterium]MCO5226276.1 phosphatidate cytidylyltransferase [Thermomicrobiales bacterium]MCO5228092.1 phosphatidate cytidylyltransferase [Thermomicrobiales bacterium]